MIPVIYTIEGKGSWQGEHNVIDINDTIKQIFPDACEPENKHSNYNICGISFSSMRPAFNSCYSGEYRTPIGIQMDFRDHTGATVRRAVKFTKDLMVDDVKLKERFNELLKLLALSEEICEAKNKKRTLDNNKEAELRQKGDEILGNAIPWTLRLVNDMVRFEINTGDTFLIEQIFNSIGNILKNYKPKN